MKIAHKLFINAGSGLYNPHRLPEIFRENNWKEIRVDIDPAVKPDVLASTHDLSHFDTDSMDAIYSSHNLEHLYIHDVSIAFSEFVRVLKPQGFVIITLPDLKKIAQLVVEDKLNDIVYQSKMGPVTAFDMLFGHKESLQKGNLYMAHNSGFTANSLGQLMLDAGFNEVRIQSGNNYDLWAIGIMSQVDTDFFTEIAEKGMVM